MMKEIEIDFNQKLLFTIKGQEVEFWCYPTHQHGNLKIFCGSSSKMPIRRLEMVEKEKLIQKEGSEVDISTANLNYSGS